MFLVPPPLVAHIPPYRTPFQTKQNNALFRSQVSIGLPYSSGHKLMEDFALRSVCLYDTANFHNDSGHATGLQ